MERVWQPPEHLTWGVILFGRYSWQAYIWREIGCLIRPEALPCFQQQKQTLSDLETN